MKPKTATEFAQQYEVAFSVFACIESEPRGERVPCHITLRFLQRLDFEGDVVILKKPNHIGNWTDVTKVCKPSLNKRDNTVTIYAETYSM